MLKTSPLKEVYDLFAEDLRKVDGLIKASLTYRDKSIETIANYVISAGGKRLRPLFAIISARLFGYKGDNHIRIAAAIEFIHTATLLHDDVIDESDMRRGRITANERWGNKYAILVGDFLFSQSFKLMVDTRSIAVLDTLSKSSSIIAEGEIKQLNNIRNINITEGEYIEIIKAKTAELFAAACGAGAIIAKQIAETQAQRYHLGLNMGIAFQIIDDILDYNPSSITGKDTGNDYKEGKITLPVIFALALASVDERKFIEKLFKVLDQESEDFASFLLILNKYNCFDKAKCVAVAFLDKATSILKTVNGDKEISSAFQTILDYQINRIR